MTDQPIPFEQALYYVMSYLKQDGYCRFLVLKELRRLGVWHIDRAALLAARVQEAVKLLGTGMSRAEARAVLMERLGVSRRTAYKLLEIALNRRRSGPCAPLGALRVRSVATGNQLEFDL